MNVASKTKKQVRGVGVTITRYTTALDEIKERSFKSRPVKEFFKPHYKIILLASSLLLKGQQGKVTQGQRLNEYVKLGIKGSSRQIQKQEKVIGSRSCENYGETRSFLKIILKIDVFQTHHARRGLVYFEDRNLNIQQYQQKFTTLPICVIYQIQQFQTLGV